MPSAKQLAASRAYRAELQALGFDIARFAEWTAEDRVIADRVYDMVLQEIDT